MLEEIKKLTKTKQTQFKAGINHFLGSAMEPKTRIMPDDIKELKNSVQKLVKEVAAFCRIDCNPKKGVILCNAKGCIGKKLYSFLVQGLYLFERKKNE